MRDEHLRIQDLDETAKRQVQIDARVPENIPGAFISHKGRLIDLDKSKLPPTLSVAFKDNNS